MAAGLLTVWRILHFSFLLPGEGIVQPASCQGARCPAPRGYAWRTSREVLQSELPKGHTTRDASVIATMCKSVWLRGILQYKSPKRAS